MSNDQSTGGDGTPRSFPEVTPSEFASHKNTISFALGELTAQVRHLSDNVRELATKIDKNSDDTKKEFRDQKATLDIIKDKVLVAETQVSLAFFTSKWFLVTIAAIIGWVVGNRAWIAKFFQSMS